MQYALLIHQGTSPLPDTDAWQALPQEEQTAIYAQYAELNRDERITPGPPLGLPADRAARSASRTAPPWRPTAHTTTTPSAA